MLEPLGYELPATDVGLDSLFDEYLRLYRESWRTFPGALTLLHELRTQGYRVGLLTNGSEQQQLDKLVRTGLATAFDAVCISERIGFQKPDARAFLALARELGVDASDCLFVGDNAAHDVAGARSAGMRAVLVDHDAQGAVSIKLATAMRKAR